MAIRFLPREFAKKLAPKKLVRKLLTRKLSVNKATLSMLAQTPYIKKDTLEEIAIKVIRGYKENIQQEVDDGATVAEAETAVVADKVLLVQRVQNSLVHEVAKKVKSVYRGEFYIWLPSEAVIPDPIHQLNYGKTFQLGVGEAPGDRYGCQCGMDIQTTDTQIDI